VRLPSALAHVRAEARQHGVGRTARVFGGLGAQYAAGFVTAGRAGGPAFVYEGEPVPYFRHRYNRTWMTERAVEVALAQRAFEAVGRGRVLEVGNVLPHYGTRGHDVVDKYETAPGVLNADIVDAPLEGKYDLVLSVSTVEHIGLDEPERDPDKARRALERMVGLLAPGGRLWVTLPIGYNLALDGQLRRGELPFTRTTALRRHARPNRWEQVPLDEVWDAAYDRTAWTATGLVVGETRREDAPRGRPVRGV
jgi:hypothetical protein